MIKVQLKQSVDVSDILHDLGTSLLDRFHRFCVRIPIDRSWWVVPIKLLEVNLREKCFIKLTLHHVIKCLYLRGCVSNCDCFYEKVVHIVFCVYIR